ncbi:MAG: hypothetical protein HZC23_03690 [Rhodocyclales bacterium]|nr:hypothetical protein [Rhodocyclales bacterium]
MRLISRIAIVAWGVALGAANIYLSFPYNSSAGSYQSDAVATQSIMFIFPLIGITLIAASKQKANVFALVLMFFLSASTAYILLQGPPSLSGGVVLMVNLVVTWVGVIAAFALL